MIRKLRLVLHLPFETTCAGKGVFKKYKIVKAAQGSLY